MPQVQAFPVKSVAIGVAALIVLAMVAGVALIDVMRRAEGMRAATTSATSVLKAEPGTAIKAVVRVQADEGNGTYSAELLESSDGKTYHETANAIRVALGKDAVFVMGTGADIRPGAVVQASGTVEKGYTLRATQIVVLTGYVQVTPK